MPFSTCEFHTLGGQQQQPAPDEAAEGEVGGGGDVVVPSGQAAVREEGGKGEERCIGEKGKDEEAEDVLSRSVGRQAGEVACLQQAPTVSEGADAGGEVECCGGARVAGSSCLPARTGSVVIARVDAEAEVEKEKTSTSIAVLEDERVALGYETVCGDGDSERGDQHVKGGVAMDKVKDAGDSEKVSQDVNVVEGKVCCVPVEVDGREQPVDDGEQEAAAEVDDDRSGQSRTCSSAGDEVVIERAAAAESDDAYAHADPAADAVCDASGRASSSVRGLSAPADPQKGSDAVQERSRVISPKLRKEDELAQRREDERREGETAQRPARTGLLRENVDEDDHSHGGGGGGGDKSSAAGAASGKSVSGGARHAGRRAVSSASSSGRTRRFLSFSSCLHRVKTLRVVPASA